MNLTVVDDELDGVVRTLRLAHAQLSNIKSQFASAGDETKNEEIESIEMILELLLKKVEALRTR